MDITTAESITFCLESKGIYKTESRFTVMAGNRTGVTYFSSEIRWGVSKEAVNRIDDFIDRVLFKKVQTRLDDLLEFYVLSARAMGNSERTIAHTTTVIKMLSDYLDNQGLSTDALEIDHSQIRGFILDLQQRSRFANHPYAKPQNSSLSPRSVNSYLALCLKLLKK